MRALTLVVLVLGACPTRPVSSLDPIGEVETLLDIPIYLNRDLDILFVIDDSISMGEEQASLAVNMPRFMATLEGMHGGLPNVHVGVISSNVGIGPYAGKAGCPVGGDGGRLQTTARIPGCAPPADAYIIDERGTTQRVRNYEGTLADTFTCIASLGTGGCGFEQHLESLRLALDPATNPGFLRADAYLAVIIIADEDDCSARDPAVFDPSQDAIDAPLGPFDSFRCAEFGVECCSEPGAGCTPGPLGRSPAEYSSCQPRRDSYLRHPDEILVLLREIKGETAETPMAESLLIGGLVAGAREPFAVGANASGEPVLLPSCSSDMGEAAPAVRLGTFIDGFAERGTFQSICQDNLQGALDAFAGNIVDHMSRPCLRGLVVTEDTDPEEPGLQLDCQVSDIRYPDTPQQRETILAPCEMLDSDHFDPDASSLPCWWVRQGLDACPVTEWTPTGLILTVERGAGQPLVGTHLIARCVATEPRCGDNHLDEGESCDDGNNYDGDGCPGDCHL